MGKRLGELLGAISENEALKKRPMLSAVAVTTAGTPGEGFYVLAKHLGLLGSDDTEARKAFWKDQQRKVYDIWQQKFAK